MRCNQFENRLNDVLDRRDDPRRDDLLMTHAAACRSCRDLAATYAVLTAGAAQLRTDASRSLLVPTTAQRLPRSAVYLGPLLATAAVALFAFFPPATNNVPPAIDPAPIVSPAVAATAAPIMPQSVSPTPVVVDLARSTGRAYVGLIHGTVRGVDEALALASAVPPPDQLLKPMLFPEDGLLRRMEDEWAPVAGETFDALRQVFQSDGSQQL